MSKSDWVRLRAVIEWSNMSVNSFARHIGLPCGENLYRIERGQNGISRNLADRVVANYPQISKGWLLSGEGSMFRDETAMQFQIPFYPGSMHEVLNDLAELEPMCYFTLPRAERCDIAVEYSPDNSGLQDGKLILLLQEKGAGELVAGKIYVFVSAESTLLCKWDGRSEVAERASKIYLLKGRIEITE